MSTTNSSKPVEDDKRRKEEIQRLMRQGFSQHEAEQRLEILAEEKKLERPAKGPFKSGGFY